MDEAEMLDAPKDVVAFDRPKVVTFAAAARSLWGAEASGQVVDVFYGRNARIGALAFRMKPGGFFRATHAEMSLFDQHRYYFVVEGELAVQDPQSGEVQLARAGEAIHWRGAKGHCAYNFTAAETVVIDWYAPQERPPHMAEVADDGARPASGGAYRPGRAELLGRWPEALQRTRREVEEKGGITRITRAEALQFIHGERHPVLESIYVSTRELTAGVVELMPGARSEDRAHPGDKVIFNLAGRLHVYLPKCSGLFELGPLDVLYLPGDTPHQYLNNGAEPLRFAFLVVPDYA